MGLTRCRLGDLISENTIVNGKGLYGIDRVRGISKNKTIMGKSRAEVDEATARKFLVVAPGEFVYNPRTDRMGGTLGLAYNNTSDDLLFSFNNIAFRLNDLSKTILCAEYLYMFFNRKEFDRYVRFNSWGSATQLFTFDDLCEVEIDLPPIEVQRRYAAIYEGLDGNRRDNLRRLGDLKLACDAEVEQLNSRYAVEAISPYIERVDERNSDGLGVDVVKGLSVSKQIIETNANLSGVNLASYKVVHPGDLVYLPDTSRRGDKISLCINNMGTDCIVSPINTVFRVRSSCADRLLPEYLMLFFTRGEFDRYARYHSWGSARETFDWDEMCAVRIPIPDIEVQQALVDLYRARSMRGGINQRLVCLLQNICPVLIKGSIDEARREG